MCLKSAILMIVVDISGKLCDMFGPKPTGLEKRTLLVLRVNFDFCLHHHSDIFNRSTYFQYSLRPWRLFCFFIVLIVQTGGGVCLYMASAFIPAKVQVVQIKANFCIRVVTLIPWFGDGRGEGGNEAGGLVHGQADGVLVHKRYFMSLPCKNCTIWSLHCLRTLTHDIGECSTCGVGGFLVFPKMNILCL
jgi:hypothetical protein